MLPGSQEAYKTQLIVGKGDLGSSCDPVSFQPLCTGVHLPLHQGATVFGDGATNVPEGGALFSQAQRLHRDAMELSSSLSASPHLCTPQKDEGTALGQARKQSLPGPDMPVPC